MKKLWNRIKGYWFDLTYVSLEEKQTKVFRKMINRMYKGTGVTWETLSDPSRRVWKEFPWTEEEDNRFQTWAKKYALRKLGTTEKYVERFVGEINLMWGRTVKRD